jgi:hypothetical protein
MGHIMPIIAWLPIGICPPMTRGDPARTNSSIHAPTTIVRFIEGLLSRCVRDGVPHHVYDLIYVAAELPDIAVTFISAVHGPHPDATAPGKCRLT